MLHASLSDCLGLLRSQGWKVPVSPLCLGRACPKDTGCLAAWLVMSCAACRTRGSALCPHQGLEGTFGSGTPLVLAPAECGWAAELSDSQLTEEGTWSRSGVGQGWVLVDMG